MCTEQDCAHIKEASGCEDILAVFCASWGVQSCQGSLQKCLRWVRVQGHVAWRRLSIWPQALSIFSKERSDHKNIRCCRTWAGFASQPTPFLQQLQTKGDAAVIPVLVPLCMPHKSPASYQTGCRTDRGLFQTSQKLAGFN